MLEREISSCSISGPNCHKKEKHVTDKDQPKVYIDKPYPEALQFILTHNEKREQAQKHTRQKEIVVHIKTHSINHKPEHKDWALFSTK